MALALVGQKRVTWTHDPDEEAEIIMRRPWPPTQFQVEVSGRDEQNYFFADITTVELSEGTSKMFRSARYLSPGSVVFLRVINRKGPNGVPLPYRVGRVELMTSGGWMTWLFPFQKNESITPVLNMAS